MDSFIVRHNLCTNMSVHHVFISRYAQGLSRAMLLGLEGCT